MTFIHIRERAALAYKKLEQEKLRYQMAKESENLEKLNRYLARHFEHGLTIDDFYQQEIIIKPYVSGHQVTGFYLMNECPDCGKSAPTTRVHDWASLHRTLQNPIISSVFHTCTAQREPAPSPWDQLQKALDEYIDWRTDGD